MAEPAAGGLRWPDWADPDGRRSDTHFTSFDDGAAGISDYLWTLYEVTHEPRFRAGALAGMRWLVAQAEGRSCPETACSWRWTDDPARRVAHYGVGMGQAGIVLVLDAFADRTGDSTFRAYARAGAARLRELTANGTRPLPRSSDESATHETGFLSGSAGAAYMFLERYRRDRDPVDLATARRLLAWVNDQAGRRFGGRRSAGRSPATPAPGRPRASSSESPGSRGSTCRPPGRPATRPTASVRARAGSWLRRVAVRGGAWEELPGDPDSPLHVGLDSGAAGIGWVLEDLARAGIDTTANRAAARAALAGLRAEARHDRLGAFWYESRTGAGRRLRAEPSWHWGAAGIAAFAARLAGWSGLTPAGSPEADPPDNLTRSALRMREDAATSSVRFEPLHPASRTSLIVGVVLGPLLWLVVTRHRRVALRVHLGDRARPARDRRVVRRRAGRPRTAPSRARAAGEAVCGQPAELLLAFVALYPVCTAASLDRRRAPLPPAGGAAMPPRNPKEGGRA